MSEKSQILGDLKRKNLPLFRSPPVAREMTSLHLVSGTEKLSRLSFPPSSSNYGALCYHQVRSQQHLQGGQSVYTEAGEDIEAMPPTTDALLRHTKRSKY